MRVRPRSSASGSALCAASASDSLASTWARPTRPESASIVANSARPSAKTHLERGYERPLAQAGEHLRAGERHVLHRQRAAGHQVAPAPTGGCIRRVNTSFQARLVPAGRIPLRELDSTSARSTPSPSTEDMSASASDSSRTESS